jgi:hypothetical protein
MPGGRPTDYRPEYVEEAAKLSALGATDAQMADFFGVVISTFYLWRNTHPEFSDAIKLSKQEADKRVEQSLYHRAIGYERDSVKIFCSKDGEITQVPYREYVPPDATSMIFWLKNRKPAEWRDRQEHTGADGGPIQIISTIPRPPKE